MKKYTIRVEPQMAQLIESVYGNERKFSISQSISVPSMNTFLTSCIEKGIVSHSDSLEAGRSQLSPDHKTALEVMEELLEL